MINEPIKILIIGGVAGGATTATRLRRLNEEAEIIMFEKGDYVSYANCGLPYYIGNTIADRNKLFVQTLSGFAKRFKIDVRIKSEVQRIDPEKKEITILNLQTNEVYTETYDKLVVSTGAEPLRPAIPGIDNERIFTLRDVSDTDNIKHFIQEKNPRRAVVMGGGFIGMEMAENLHELGIHVSIVEMSNQVMKPLDYSMAAIVHQKLQSKNVDLFLEKKINGFKQKENGLIVSLDDQSAIETDMVICSIGVIPDSRLAKNAGLAIGSLGGIIVNEYMQTSNPDIYALGDAVEVFNPILKESALIPLAGPANKQARIVANNLVFGNHYRYNGSIGTSIVKIFDSTAAVAGVAAKVLKSKGINYLSSTIHTISHAGYYPDAEPLTIKIVFSPETGQLFGAQVVGQDGIDKRIEMLSQVIKNNGTIYDLTEIEQAYAPPYSSAKDPVNIAGFVAENMLMKKAENINWRDVSGINFDNDFLLDVRMPIEFVAGHISGAVNIPLDELRERVKELPDNKNIIVYCAVGLRGYLASRILLQNGFKQVKNLSGGYRTYSLACKTFVKS